MNKKLGLKDLDSATLGAFLKMSDQDSLPKNSKSTESKRKKNKKGDKDDLEVVDICKAWKQPKEEEKISKIQELPSRELSEDQTQLDDHQKKPHQDTSMQALKEKLAANKLYKPESRIKEVEPVPRIDPTVDEKPVKYPMDEFGMFNSSSIKTSLKEKLKMKAEEGKESPSKL